MATDDAATLGGIGTDIPRPEDRPLVTGEARFVGDIHLHREAHMYIVRSMLPHAEIRSVDLDAARDMPGVVLAFSAADCPSPLPKITVRSRSPEGLDPFLQYPLASDRARYVGEPVAVIVAESRYLAEDAAELVEIDYEPLDAVASIEAALDDGAPALHDGPAGNIARIREFPAGEHPDAVLEACDVVFTERFSVGRGTAAPMETRGLLADYDHSREFFTLWGATKAPYYNRRVLASALDMPEHRVRLVETHVGGGFGSRGELYPEDFLVAFASKALRRPVKWIEDRREHLTAANHSRQQEWEITLGATDDGDIKAIRATMRMDIGGYVRTHGVRVPSISSGMLRGPYDIPSYYCDFTAVLTNKTPVGTYRSPGRYEANFVRERMIDLLAERLGIDRVELRRQNLIPVEAMPFDTGMLLDGEQIVYDSGDYAASMQLVADRIGFDELAELKASAEGSGRLLGAGIAPFVEHSGSGTFETATARIDSTGKVVLATGLAEMGQKQETMLSQICASVLNLNPAEITVIHGDTDASPTGAGTYASRGAVMGGNAAYLAAQRLRERIVRVAAHALDATPKEIETADGAVFLASDTDREHAMTFAELFPLVDRPEIGLEDDAQGFVVNVRYRAEPGFWGYGTKGTVVEIDPETGKVEVKRFVVHYDVGRIINPSLCEGQIVGGAAQGIGGALLESLDYSEDGQPQSASFMDYMLPLATEVPRVECIITEDFPSPLNPLGVKGVGEAGIAAAGAAIGNAVADALSGTGGIVRTLPLTPSRVLALINEGASE